MFDGQMISAQGQLFGGVFAVYGSVESKLESVCLADQEAMGGQDCSVRVGDGEAKLTGPILCAGWLDTQQRYEGGDGGGE